MRLIDADALIEKFNEKVDMAECLVDARTAERFATFCALADAVEEMPTADAEVVVRCKDCKYLRVWNQKDLYAFCPKTNFVFLPFQADTREHFCSLGKPKET